MALVAQRVLMPMWVAWRVSSWLERAQVAGAPTVARSVIVRAMTSLSLSASRARLRKSKLGVALWEGWLRRRTSGQRRERIGGGSVAEQPADSVVGEDLVADHDHKEPAGRAA